SLQNLDGTRVLFSDVRDLDQSVSERLTVGLHTFEITIPARLLAATTYLLSVEAGGRYAGILDQRDSSCEFTLRDLATQNQSRAGVLGIQLPWEHQVNPAEVALGPKAG